MRRPNHVYLLQYETRFLYVVSTLAFRTRRLLPPAARQRGQRERSQSTQHERPLDPRPDATPTRTAKAPVATRCRMTCSTPHCPPSGRGCRRGSEVRGESGSACRRTDTGDGGASDHHRRAQRPAASNPAATTAMPAAVATTAPGSGRSPRGRPQRRSASAPQSRSARRSAGPWSMASNRRSAAAATPPRGGSIGTNVIRSTAEKHTTSSTVAGGSEPRTAARAAPLASRRPGAPARRR
jgi:hypothetical protein